MQDCSSCSGHKCGAGAARSEVQPHLWLELLFEAASATVACDSLLAVLCCSWGSWRS
jgi:hypothetical protein